jgi:hypothetical protein
VGPKNWINQRLEAMVISRGVHASEEKSKYVITPHLKVHGAPEGRLIVN